MQTHLNFVAVFKIILMIFWATIPLLVACWAFEDVIDRFDNSNMYEICDWYKFPMKVQRIIPIIVANTDESRKKILYLNTSCSCDTVKNVISEFVHLWTLAHTKKTLKFKLF